MFKWEIQVHYRDSRTIVHWPHWLYTPKDVKEWMIHLCETNDIRVWLSGDWTCPIWAINFCIISSCNMSVIFPPSSHSPSIGPSHWSIPILLRILEHYSSSWHLNFFSPPTPPAPPLRTHFPLLTWWFLLVFLLLLSPLAFHPLHRRLLFLRLFPIIAWTSLWGRWEGGHTDLPQDRDNILLHQHLPHHPLPLGKLDISSIFSRASNSMHVGLLRRSETQITASKPLSAPRFLSPCPPHLLMTLRITWLKVLKISVLPKETHFYTVKTSFAQKIGFRPIKNRKRDKSYCPRQFDGLDCYSASETNDISNTVQK